MGVQNLWVLLAPVGRQIEIESLATKVLAVDASIWLTQFVKAMRDDEGNMIKNAHLIGTFHRVAKLLFYRIKPVFVFDGQTPEIKKKTTARRRKRQEHQAANLKQTAQRILINRLKLQREELKRNGGKPAPAVDPNFVLPEVNGKSRQQQNQEENEQKCGDAEKSQAGKTAGSASCVIEIDGRSSDEEEKGEMEPKRTPAAPVDAEQKEERDSDSDDDDEDDDLTIDDIEVDTSQLSKIDLQAVFALPAHLQKDMINRILRDRRQEVRNKFIPLAGKPEAYSHTQIASFLATSALHKRIEAAKKKNREQIEGVGESGVSLGPGKRIASRSDRFFVYKKAEDQGDDDSDGDGREKGNSNEEVNGDNVVNEIEKVVSETRGSIFGTAADGADGFPLPARFKNNRKRRYDDDEEVGKRTLSDFSVGSVKEFAMQAQKQQARKWAVESATSAWIAKQETQSKSEPTLAIEMARQKRLKLEDAEAVANTEKTGEVVIASPQENESICITFKAEEVEETNLDLFPASIFETVLKTTEQATTTHQDATGNKSDDEDDVEWEEVASTTDKAPVVAEKAQGVHDLERKQPDLADVFDAGAAVHIADGDEDGDDVEWEEVQSEEKSAASLLGPTSVAADNSTLPLEELENAGGGNEESEDEDTDEMYLSLKNELEDAKAEEDLEELKGEALKSALATASNLTQWAAGAVRRALAAHSQQHKRIVESAYPIQGKTSPVNGPGVSFQQAIEIEDEEEKNDGDEAKDDESAIEKHHSSTPIDVDPSNTGSIPPTTSEDMEEGNDEYLQQAIASSMAEDAAKPSGSRYLQYSSPPSSSPLPSFPQQSGEAVIDVASLEAEQNELKKLRNRQLRDVEGFSDEMVGDVMELLRLFGVPYLVCPMEAEAQCAALEQLGLVDGIITDDSDIFPFGGKKVYKNIFHNQKFVEAFFAQDIEKELGFSQEEMIALALLLGSDYTDGIRGIGIVNATEVVNAYPGLEGLGEFKKWVQAFDLAEEAQRLKDRNAKKSEAEIAEMAPREKFQYTHASVRRKWELGDEFPNSQVVKAYTNPQVDHSDARFSWSLPDLAALRNYAARTFGWDQPKADGVLLPLMEKVATSGRGVQTRIDQFFTNYDDEVRYAKIQSKRLRSAVESRTRDSGEKKSAVAGVNAAKPKSTPTPKKTRVTKKKTTLSALGFGTKKGNPGRFQGNDFAESDLLVERRHRTSGEAIVVDHEAPGQARDPRRLQRSSTMESRGRSLSSAGAAMIMNRTSKMPQTLTLDHVSPATRLLEKRRQMFEVQEALDAQKEEFARREDAFHRREEGLRKKDLELQESLIKFNKFLQENESKRNRAVKRANDEIKQRLTKEQEVAKLKEHLEQLMVESEKLGNEVKKNMKYTRYLEVVQETVPEDYPEVADLVNRYHTLKETNRDLRQNQVLHEEENEVKRLEFASFQKERANEILNFNNKIASLQRELETEELQTIRLQHEADASMRMTTQKTLALGQIVMAIGNLLQRCTSGIHGQILKHMDGSNNAAAAAAQASGESSSSANTDAASSSLPSASSNISEADVIQHGLKAMADLEVVAAYMVDFTAIVQGRIDAQRAQKRSSNQSVPAVAAGNGPAANPADTGSHSSK